jgi:hypothetical protein
VLGAALVLLLSFFASPIAHIVCGVKCADAAHHERAAAPAAGCHDEVPAGDAVALTNGVDGVCHDQADSFTATVADRTAPRTTAALAQIPLTFSVNHRAPFLVARRRSPSRGDVVPLTIQLRI